MNKQTNNDKKTGKKKYVIIFLVVFLILFLLFPRRYTYLDGGSVAYGSFGFGIIYKVEQRHGLPQTVDADGYGYYENGTVISIFGIEIYNNAHTDYDDLAIAPHDPNNETSPHN